MASVTLKNLVKRFGKVTAVDGVSLDIRDGEFIILLGPSGCGKSTMLYSIAGLEDISGGEIYIGERLMNRVPPKARNIAMVFQDYALYPHMNVYANMAFGLKLRRASKAEIERRVQHAAGLLGIEHLLQRRPRELSGGQRQRVALGRAIVREPAVFLMDEPLSNLDAILRVQMRMEISKLHRRLNTTFIYVTHDQIEAVTMGDRIVVLKEGVIQQVGSPREVFETPANVFVAGFIGTPSMNFMRGTLVAKDGVLSLDTGSFRVPLGPGLTSAAGRYEGRAVIAGIRPSAIDTAAPGEILGGKEAGVIHSRVEVVEPMGDVAYIVTDADGQAFTVRVDPLRLPATGQIVPLRISGAAIHLFDGETQKVIAHGSREAAATPVAET
jgi:multiple sugar transport system ATP-binding protein